MADRLHSRRFDDDIRHIALGDVVSTNTVCFDNARSGDAGPLWVTARRQTGGRGRRGRPWVSEAGNLYASLLLTDPGPMEAVRTLPLAVAVTVHAAISRVVPASGHPVEIKWPNDVLIARAKTCGILLESETTRDGRLVVVIGIGINMVARPDMAHYPVTCLAEQGVHISPEELFAHLYVEMNRALAVWNGGAGAAGIVARWRAAACGIGERITVNLPDRSLTGRFAGIDDQGYLILETGRDTMSIAAGDVFFA